MQFTLASSCGSGPDVLAVFELFALLLPGGALAMAALWFLTSSEPDAIFRAPRRSFRPEEPATLVLSPMFSAYPRENLVRPMVSAILAVHLVVATIAAMAIAEVHGVRPDLAAAGMAAVCLVIGWKTEERWAYWPFAIAVFLMPCVWTARAACYPCGY